MRHQVFVSSEAVSKIEFLPFSKCIPSVPISCLVHVDNRAWRETELKAEQTPVLTEIDQVL